MNGVRLNSPRFRHWVPMKNNSHGKRRTKNTEESKNNSFLQASGAKVPMKSITAPIIDLYLFSLWSVRINHEDLKDRKETGVSLARSWTGAVCQRRGGLRPAFVPEHRRKARVRYSGYVSLNIFRFPAVLGYKRRSALRWPLRWQTQLDIYHLLALRSSRSLWFFREWLNTCIDPGKSQRRTACISRQLTTAGPGEKCRLSQKTPCSPGVFSVAVLFSVATV